VALAATGVVADWVGLGVRVGVGVGVGVGDGVAVALGGVTWVALGWVMGLAASCGTVIETHAWRTSTDARMSKHTPRPNEVIQRSYVRMLSDY